jgi:lipopolysaccharide transport system ATP-binding protein
MSAVAIRVEGLSKLYRLGEAERYRTLRDSLTDTFLAPFRRLRRGTSPKREAETHWALKDISFDVKHGEVIGIIGRNGAGKSTLLKILSRITEPTDGHAEIHGRVGSLLEVGTGFHPELTGRENIFLNGAILGMKKAEILRKFDEIVAFAEVERFIDTAVKHYSSGMYVRLAFAVAAHMEPDILIIDEVLAVGDQRFQNKCLDKMGEVGKEGRTVLFVSHNLAAISSLCSSAILLEQGNLVENDVTDVVLHRYLTDPASRVRSVFCADMTKTKPDQTLKIIEASLHDLAGRQQNKFAYGDPVVFRASLDGVVPTAPIQFVVQIHTATEVPVLHLMSHYTNECASNRGAVLSVECLLECCPLYPGDYRVSLWVGTSPHQGLDWVRHALMFTMTPGVLLSYGVDLTWRHGVVHQETTWRFGWQEALR